MDNGFHEWMQKALDSGIDGEDPFELSQAAWDHLEKRIDDLIAKLAIKESEIADFYRLQGEWEKELKHQAAQSTKLSDLILALQENGEKLAAQSERLAEALKPMIDIAEWLYKEAKSEDQSWSGSPKIDAEIEIARAELKAYRGE